MKYFLYWCNNSSLWSFPLFVAFIKCTSSVCCKGKGYHFTILYMPGFKEVRTKEKIYSKAFKEEKRKIDFTIIRIFSLHLSTRLPWEGLGREENVDAVKGSEMYPVSIKRKGKSNISLKAPDTF